MTQKRGARPPEAERSKKDDRAAALAVLAKVGATADHPNVQALGDVYENWAYRMAVDEAQGRLADEGESWREFQTIKRALDGLKLKTNAGCTLRRRLLQMYPLTYLQTEPLRAHEVYAARLEGYKVEHGRVVPPSTSSTDVKRGRPVESIQVTLDVARTVFGWDWKACAAAVFVTGAWRLDYAFAVKSFRDSDRRNRRRGMGET
jgi:hypothetical protein